MWSEEWDKKIQTAASNSEPSFQEKSWDQMEALLEKHLPAEKKRRRLFILFFTLLTTGALVFLILQQRPAKPGLTSTESALQTPATTPLTGTGKESSTEPPTEKTASPDNNRKPVTATSPPVGNAALIPDQQNASVSADTRMATGKNRTAQKHLPASAPAAEQSRKQTSATQKNTANQPAEDKRNDTNIIIIGNDVGSVKKPVQQAQSEVTVPAIADSSVTDNTAEQVAADSAAETAKPSNKTSKARQSFSKRFGISASLGVDLNGVHLNELNNAKTIWGVGLSYDISRRITMRTGFFASRKIYVADPSDYHPPYNFWNYYPNLQKIDANCMIYEIPLSVIYNGGNTAKNHWFASAGLSSLIMKSEEYGYSYKDASGQPRYYTRSLYNKNQHLFSTLQLSGGYTVRLSPRASLLAEPYLKLPVSGIGYGKVRLYSAGIMLSAIVKPFAKN